MQSSHPSGHLSFLEMLCLQSCCSQCEFLFYIILVEPFLLKNTNFEMRILNETWKSREATSVGSLTDAADE